MSARLEVAYDNTLYVLNVKGERIGCVAPSGEDEWATYRCSPSGAVIERRIATSPTIANAVTQLFAHRAMVDDDPVDEECCDGCGEPFGEYDGRYHKHCG